MNLLNNIINPKKDKLLHFYYGTIISLILLFLTKLGLNPIFIPILTAVIASGKEIYDKLIKKTRFDYIDLIYTILTSIIIYLYLIIK